MEEKATIVTVGAQEFHFRYSSEIKNLMTALVKASKNIKSAEKDANNTHFNNSYATIESLILASKSALLDEDVLVIQMPSEKILTTRVQHVSGEYMECDMKLIIEKQTMQGLGSAITYGRRQSLSAILNLAQADDDGNKASAEGKAAKQARATIKPSGSKDKDKLPFE